MTICPCCKRPIQEQGLVLDSIHILKENGVRLATLKGNTLTWREWPTDEEIKQVRGLVREIHLPKDRHYLL